MVLQNFNGTAVPVNGDGDGYPNEMGPYGSEGGHATLSLDSSTAVSGTSLRLHLTDGRLYAQFNPYNYAGNPAYPSPRGFAHDYALSPAAWQFNTYDRLTLWIKVPTSDTSFVSNGSHGTEFGTYVKTVTNADPTTDETNNGHYYHELNLPNTGTWVQVVVNMHPDHQRSVNADPGILAHPTGESAYNYFDALTRFYVDEPYASPSAYPADYYFDDIQFSKSAYQENDRQVYSVAASYRASDNRLVVTWNRDMAEDTVQDEVRYSFSDIHAGGWASATAAPNGVLTPPGSGGYNGMVYDSTALPLAGHSVVYIAIKPQNSSLFTQVAVPLNLN